MCLYLERNNKCNILVLGRNNNDIKKYVGDKVVLTEDKKIILKNRKLEKNIVNNENTNKMNISYMTMHRS